MSGERETGKGKRGTGKPATGNQEQKSGEECSAVTRLTVQNGGQRKRKVNKCYSWKLEFLQDLPPDGKYLLVRAESHWNKDKHIIKWRLGRKSNRRYHMLPQLVRPQSFLNRISS